MSYRAASHGLANIGIADVSDPHVLCDGCGLQRPVMGRTSYRPYAWLLNGQKAPGWFGGRKADGMSREDWCPECWTKKVCEDRAGAKPKLAAFVAKWRKAQAESYAGAGFTVAYDAIGDLLDELEELLK